ncbi:hypothetical protein ABT075_09605 [Streptomyces sp. NPDC002677]|uniref:hypothetical protein n=1 Tax=Streptomyces sp. NPDC002677 TaxID=3154774 RepID=UPI0033179024
MAATPAPTPETEVAETGEVEIEKNENAEARVEAAENEPSGTEISVRAVENEVDLDALFNSARGDLRDHKEAAEAARGRVRQVARQRRQKHRREITKSLSEIAPRVAIHGLTAAGFIAFSIALVFFAAGTIGAGLTLCTVSAAAWGLAAVLRR